MQESHAVAEHWSQTRNIREILEEIYESAGVFEPGLELAERLDRAARFDQMHGGGVGASRTLLQLLDLPAERELRGIDIGSGMGGTLRWFANQTGARIEGVDITPAFVQASEALTARLGMQDRCPARVGNATQIPFSADSFDFGLLMAVSCNIPDRSQLYREIARVLRPLGRVGMLDILAGPNPGIVLPVPWSRDGAADTSLLLDREQTIAACATAGLELVASRDISPEATAWFQDELAAIRENRPARIERFVPDWQAMMQSQLANMQRGHIRFECLVFEKADTKPLNSRA